MRRIRWLGPYQLLYRIASGGMAEIHRAVVTTSDGTQHDVAIKRLLSSFNDDEAFIEMLEDEAHLTALFDHPNLVRTLEFGVVDGQHLLVMEFINGRDLRSVLRRTLERGEVLPLGLATYAVEQALRGLHSAHIQHDEAGQPAQVVHRDFSPSNILVGYNGSIKLIDFGIAKARFSRSQTQGGIIKGKISFMSPEQTLGRRLGPASDVFAAGVVLYRALTGHLPFHAPEDAPAMVAIREQQPDPPSAHRDDVGPALDAIVAQALHKVPEARHRSAEAFADSLQRWREAHGHTQGASAMGPFITQIFAQERSEHQALYDEQDLTLSLVELTPAGVQAEYTRLVDAGRFTGVEASGSAHEVDEWLAQRRRGGTDHVWTGTDTQPTWLDSDPTIDGTSD